MDVTPSHKILDTLQHLSVYLSGVFAFILAAIGMWWRDRRADKKRIYTLEMLAEGMATKDELAECGKDKDKQHHEGIKDVLKAVQGVRDDNKKSNETNSQQHQDILEKMVDLHQ